MTSKKCSVVSLALLPVFVMVTSLFALWGFANDITNPMVAAFKNILLLDNFQSSLVQFAFYGGYLLMSFPAAFFVKRYSYKKGVLMGLGLYSLGCFLFLPAGYTMAFWAFLIAYFIMTSGLSFLETCANPLILSLGDEETSTRRLNFAQSFNPMGSLAGMAIARNFILQKLDPMDVGTREALRTQSEGAFQKIAESDVGVIVGPYAILGIVVALFFLAFLFVKLPENEQYDKEKGLDIVGTFKRLFTNRLYTQGVVAQMFYVGVQIMVWTFILQYASLTLGMRNADAQTYNIIAMVMFCTFRFVCTFLLRFFHPGALLFLLATLGGALTLVVIFGGGNPNAGVAFTEMLNGTEPSFWAHTMVYLKAPFVIEGMSGLGALVMISGCMSLMFPTIYGIALREVGRDAKIGAAGLVMGVGGGCLMTPLQAIIMDQYGAGKIFETAVTAVRGSFALPLLCFIIIMAYGVSTRIYFRHHKST